MIPYLRNISKTHPLPHQQNRKRLVPMEESQNENYFPIFEAFLHISCFSSPVWPLLEAWVMPNLNVALVTHQQSPRNQRALLNCRRFSLGSINYPEWWGKSSAKVRACVCLWPMGSSVSLLWASREGSVGLVDPRAINPGNVQVPVILGSPVGIRRERGESPANVSKKLLRAVL